MKKLGSYFTKNGKFFGIRLSAFYQLAKSLIPLTEEEKNILKNKNVSIKYQLG